MQLSPQARWTLSTVWWGLLAALLAVALMRGFHWLRLLLFLVCTAMFLRVLRERRRGQR